MVEITGMKPSRSSVSRIAVVDVGDVAHEAEVGVALAGHDQPGVLAAQADRPPVVAVDGRHDVAVDLAAEHHPGDVEGRRRR